MTDEEYVRANWDSCEVALRREHGDFVFWTANALYLKFAASSPEKLWFAAAEFTRDRREQIRQLEEHWVLIGAQCIDWGRSMEREEPWTNRRAFWARGYIQFLLVAARLESALADLKRGMT